MMARTVQFVLPLIAGLVLVAPAQAQLFPEDVADLRQVTSVAISPDGSEVAYLASLPRADDEDPGPAYNELFVIPADGGEPTAIIERPQSASSPAWTPDGSRLAFTAVLSEYDDRPQVYAVTPAGNDLQQLTVAPEGVLTFAFTPDGDALLYTARMPVPDDIQEQHDEGYDMSVRGGPGAYERHVRLWHQSLGAQDRRALTPDTLTVRDYIISPDGQSIAVQMTEDTGADSDLMFRRIYTVPIEGGELAYLTPTEGKLGPMAWSTDGQRLAFLGATSLNDPLAQSIFVVDAGGGNAENVTPDIEATAEWLEWTSENEIVYAAVESTVTGLHRLSVDTGETERLHGDGPEIIRSFSLADDRTTFAAPVNTREHPNEVYVGQLGQASFERLTFHNDFLNDRELSRQETIQWTGADGIPMEGVLVYPLDYQEGQRYPLAILPHGGPEGISIDGWNTRALYPAHVLATEGYVVFEPNYRGSGGLGPAFSMANHRDLGGKEFEDVLLGISYLDEIGLIDPERVGISGTSYGGYFSAWAGTRYPERFAAAITFAGLTNWVSFMGTTDIPYEMTLVHWDVWYWESPGLYMDRSPVRYAHQTDVPIMVATGLADERVHPEQAEQFYEYLLLNDVPTELVRYPREPHGLLERAHQLDFMQRVLRWFGEHLSE